MKHKNINKASFSHSEINENETAKEAKERIARERRERAKERWARELRERAIKHCQDYDIWCAIPRNPSKDRE